MTPEHWMIVTKPGATLTQIDPGPALRPDGATWQRYSTAHGKVFARVIEANGLVLWYMKIVAQG